MREQNVLKVYVEDKRKDKWRLAALFHNQHSKFKHAARMY